MKHSKLFFLQVMLMSIMSSNVSAYDFSAINGDGVTIYYNYDGDGVSVTSKDENYNSYSGEVRIPSLVSYSAQEYSVIGIGDNAFRSCRDLTSIEIPSGVTSIGDYALYYCEGLASLIIPSNVLSIGDYAFAGCTGLTSIEIPSSVTSIGEGAFGGCSGLSTITVATGNTKYDSRNNCNAIIETNGNKLVAGCNNTIIPSSVTSIGVYAFAGCTGLTSIEIPSGVTSIGEYAFWSCYGLTNIIIPSNVTSIGLAAFSTFFMTSITVERSEPIVLTHVICENPSSVILNVPSGSKAAYEAADYWKDFKEIREFGNAAFTMNSNSIATYSNNNGLDFTDVEGLKAYIASGFSPTTGELMMVRVNKVPAGEGLLLKGAAGDYEIPYTHTDMYYSNLLVGVPTATTVNPTDGSFTNFILANDEVKGIGFYTLSAAGEIDANKAYLQLPTSVLPTSSRQLRMVFDDEEISGNEELRMKSEEFATAAWYSLDGRKLSQEPTTKGLYIRGNKKVVVK
jgi:hypothetical protein